MPYLHTPPRALPTAVLLNSALQLRIADAELKSLQTQGYLGTTATHSDHTVVITLKHKPSKP